METISTLLQEAKPLYFKRKKRYHQIKMGVCSLSVIGLVLMLPLSYNWQKQDSSAESLYLCLYDDASFEKAFYIPSNQMDYL